MCPFPQKIPTRAPSCVTRKMTNYSFLFILSFFRCHSAHLNGKYYPNGHYSGSTDDGVVWYPWRGWWYSLKTSIMKLQPVDLKIDPIDDPNAVHRTPPS